MKDNVLNPIDFLLSKKFFDNKNFLLLNNFFLDKFIIKTLDKKFFITKEHNIVGIKRNKTIFFQGLIESFIYSYFSSGSFYNILNNLYSTGVISDKKVDIYSVESFLNLPLTGRGILMDMYSFNDFYSFKFTSNDNSIGIYIYIISSKNELTLSLNGCDFSLKQNDIFFLGNSEFDIKIINKFDTEVFLFIGNLISNKYETTIINKCNIS